MSKIKILRRTIWLLFLVWSITTSIFFSYTNATSLAKGIGYLYKDLSSKVEKQDVFGKMFAENLYKSNLIQQDTIELSNIIDAVKSTIYAIKADYNCNILEEDMINILYHANQNIRWSIENIVLDNLNKKIDFPKRSEAIEACRIFSICTYWTEYKNSSFIDSPVSVENCFDTINLYFQKDYNNIKNIKSNKSINEWTDALFNGTLEDSDYDILYDIQQIGNLFFDWNKEPPTVVFYQFPELKNKNTVLPDLTIDWFNPSDPGDLNDNVDEIIDDIPDNTDDNVVSENDMGNITNNDLNDNWLEEVPIKELFQWNGLWNIINYNNPSTLIPWNSCIQLSQWEAEKISVIKPKELSPKEEVVIADEYIEELKSEIAELKCNNNLICESGETELCGDCKVITDEDWNEVLVTPDDVAEVSEILNALENATDSEAIAATKSCYQTCEDLSVSDKIVCIAKCSCGVRESKEFFDPMKYPGMSPIFKVKFCTIPPKANTFAKKAIVKTVEAISSTLYAIMSSLRNSGQLTTQVKTKEYLDTARAKSNFANQLSFTININNKRLFDNKLEITQKEEQEWFNQLGQNTILNMNSDISLPSERNKYLVVWDPAQYKAEQDPKFSYAAQDTYDINTAIDEATDVNIEEMFDNLKNSQIAQIENFVSVFLEQNRSFWIDFDEMILSLKNTAKVFKDKK